MKKQYSVLYSFLVLMLLAQLPNPISIDGRDKGIKWTTMNNLSSKKMTLVFIYKKDDGWCRRMEAITFSDPAIVKYNNKNFNCVKLEATADASEISRLGITLEGYPTTVFLNKEEEVVQDIPGYVIAKDFEEITKYFGEEIYKEKSWKEYREQYDLNNHGLQRRRKK